MFKQNITYQNLAQNVIASLCSIRIPKQNFKYQMNSTYMHNAHFFRPFVLIESKNSNFFSITIYKECSLNPSNLFDHELAVI